MAGLVGYIAALADDLATLAPQIASQTGKSIAKAGGILIDDAAVIPQFLDKTAAERELPVIAKIAKGSLRNKAIMIPVGLAITAFAPWVMAPILIAGGSYLAYEGAESLGEKLGFIKHHDDHAKNPTEGNHDLKAIEEATVKDAIKTDTVLSIEIIAITLAGIATIPLLAQASVLAAVAAVTTIGVYGAVAGIVKMDDAGFKLKEKYPDNKFLSGLGDKLINGMPKVMKALSNIGTVAMLAVGGGILSHTIPALHGVATLGAGFLPAAIAPLVGSFLAPVALGLVAGAALIFAKDKIVAPLLPKFKEKIWNPLKSLFKSDKPTDDVVINDQTNDKSINLESTGTIKDLDTNKVLSSDVIVRSNLNTISTPTDLKDIGLLDGSNQISKLSNLIPDAVNTVNESLQNVAENLLDSQQKTPIIDTPSIK